MDVAFQNPVYLVLIPAVVLMVYWSYYYTGAYVSRWKSFSFILTGVCLVLASSSPTMTIGTPEFHQIMLVDVSDSTISNIDELKQQVKTLSRPLSGTDKISILLFGDSNRWLLKRASPHRIRSSLEQFEVTRSKIDSSNTTPAEALHTALGVRRSNEVSHAILLSDGQFAPEQLNEMTSIASSAQLPVSTRLIRKGTLRDLAIQSISAPAYVRPEEPFEVKINLQASSNYDGTLRLSKTQNSEAIKTVRFSIRKNQEKTIRIELNPGPNSFQQYRVSVRTAQNEWTKKNNTSDFGVRSTETFQALWMGKKQLYEQLVPALQKSDVKFDFAERPDRTDPYDLFVIAGSSEQTSERWQRNLSSAVRHRGSGLIMLGTERSFGIGGWGNTPVDELLPVQVFPPDTLTLSILMDVSGSMGHPPDQTGSSQPSKLSVVRNALSRSMELMNPADQLELIAFSNKPNTLQTLKPIGPDPSLSSTLNALSAGGETKLLPPIRKGLDTLAKSGRKNRYMLIFTDGQLKEKRARFKALGNRANKQNVRLIILTTGNQEDRSRLQALTGNGENGRVIPLDSVNDLQPALKEELQRIRKFIQQKPMATTSESGNTNSFLSVGSERMPTRTGPYHRVTETPYAMVQLRSEAEDVLAAGWQPGRGRSIVLTPLYDQMDPLTEAERSAWVQLIRQSVQWSLPARPSDWNLRSETESNQLKIYLEHTEKDRNISSLTATGTLQNNDGWKQTDIPSTPQTPDRIQFHTPLPPAGTYQFQASLEYDGQNVQIGMPVNIPVSREYLYPSSNRSALETLAIRTGGSFLDTSTDLSGILRKQSEHERKEMSLVTYFLIAAVAGLILPLIRT